MSFIVTFIAAVFVFSAVIAIHEFGHFAVAKLCGIQVNEFSIGMGPVLWKKNHKGTQYSLRALPVGGFVALEGEESPESQQAEAVGEVVDVIQIPAFLCRQTDLLVAAARTGCTVNIKKAQFLSGDDMRYPVEKCRDAGAREVWLTERGNMFGYNNLVVDFRNIPAMKAYTPTVIMDCTHSVQRPGAAGGSTGGDRQFVPAMALAAKAFGATGYFFETHPDPDHALSDGPNMLPLDELENVITSLL